MRNLVSILTVGAVALGIAVVPVIQSAASPSQVTADASTIAISGNDLMKFDKARFEVKSGDTVTIRFTNAGTIPKVAMGHNIVVLKAGVTALAWGPKAQASGATADNDFIPAAVRGDVLAHSKTLGPGESDTITFTAPAPGEYDYLCSFPGHFSGMRGIMVVK